MLTDEKLKWAVPQKVILVYYVQLISSGTHQFQRIFHANMHPSQWILPINQWRLVGTNES